MSELPLWFRTHTHTQTQHWHERQHKQNWRNNKDKTQRNISYMIRRYGKCSEREKQRDSAKWANERDRMMARYIRNNRNGCVSNLDFMYIFLPERETNRKKKIIGRARFKYIFLLLWCRSSGSSNSTRLTLTDRMPTPLSLPLFCLQLIGTPAMDINIREGKRNVYKQGKQNKS